MVNNSNQIKKHFFIIAFYFFVINNSFGQLIEIDTISVEDMIPSYSHPDTCIYQTLTIAKENIKNLSKISDRPVIEKYGFKHYLWGNLVDQDSFIISHGKTVCYFKNGKLASEGHYSTGILLREINYNKYGFKFSEMYLDTIKGRKVEDFYEGNTIKYRKITSNTREIIQWYPNAKIDISKGEINEYIDLSVTNKFETELMISSRDKNQIVNIISESVDIFIENHLGNFEKVLSNKEIKIEKSVTLKILITHNCQHQLNKSKIRIVNNQHYLDIPIILKGSHINFDKIGKVSTLKIKQKENPRILIDQIGTETSIAFNGKDISQEKNIWSFPSLIKISDLKFEEYLLTIGSCHTSGQIKIILEK